MSGGAVVGYGEAFLEVPDLSFPLFDICEAFLGRAAAEALLRRGQAVLRSASTLQIVVTLPFECLPTLDDAYELVVDWAGLEELRPAEGAAEAEGEADGAAEGADAAATTASDDFDIGGGDAPEGSAIGNADAAAAPLASSSGASQGGAAQQKGAATTQLAAAHGHTEQYEVALLGALEAMGVGDLFALAAQQRVERRRREAASGGVGAAAAEDDDSMSLLSLGGRPASSSSHNAAAAPSPASAAALGLPPAGASLEAFGGFAYLMGTYNPFTALRSAPSWGAHAAGSGPTPQTSRLPAATIAASMLPSPAAAADGSGAGDDNVCMHNNGVVKRWRAEYCTAEGSNGGAAPLRGRERLAAAGGVGVRVTYVPHHARYVPPAVLSGPVVAFAGYE